MKIVLRKPQEASKDTQKLSFVIAFMAFMFFVINVASELERLIGANQSTISNVCKGLLFCSILVCIPAIIRNIRISTIAYLLIILLLSALSYALARGYEPIIGTIRDHILMVLPIVIIVCSIRDYILLGGMLRKVAYIIIPSSVVLLFIRQNATSDYSMGLANAITLPSVIMLYEYYRQKKLLYLLMAIIGAFVIFVLGSRGALLGIIVFEVIILLKGCKVRENRNRSIAIICIILLAFVFMDKILELVALFLGNRGWNSRTLWILLNDIGHDSGRSSYYERMIEAIKASPFSMRGIGGERIILDGGYAHNFALEIIMDFGVIIGSIINVYILLAAFRTIKNAIRNNSCFDMMRLVFFSISLPMAFVSGTIWNSVYLWIWLFMGVYKPERSIIEELKDEFSSIKYSGAN